MLKKLFAILGLLILTIATPVAAFSNGGFGDDFGNVEADLPDPYFSIDVNYDDPYSPGDIIPLEITLENTAKSDDLTGVTVKVWLEDDTDDRVTDKIKVELRRVHQDYEKELVVDLPLPGDLEEDEYTLRVTATAEWESDDRDTYAAWRGIIDVEQPDHGFNIKEVALSSSAPVAGSSLDIAVKIQNIGKEDESGVKIKAAVPELGAEKTVSLLSELREANQYTAYLTLDLPDADDGIYTLAINVYNDEAGAANEQDLFIKAAEVVTEETATVTGEAVISSVITTPTIKAGKGSIFSFEIHNTATVQKTYEFAIGGTQDWTSSARIDPAMMTLGPGEAQIAHVYILPTEAGEQVFTLYVKEGINTIASTQVNTMVEGGVATGSAAGLETLFGILLAVLILVTAGWYWKKEVAVGGKKKEKIYY